MIFVGKNFPRSSKQISISWPLKIADFLVICIGAVSLSFQNGSTM